MEKIKDKIKSSVWTQVVLITFEVLAYKLEAYPTLHMLIYLKYWLWRVKIFCRKLENTLKQLTQSFLKYLKNWEIDVLLEHKSEMTWFLWKIVYIVGRTHTLREVPSILETMKEFSKLHYFLFPGHQLNSLVSRWFTPEADSIDNQTHSAETQHDGPNHGQHNCVVRRTLVH